VSRRANVYSSFHVYVRRGLLADRMAGDVKEPMIEFREREGLPQISLYPGYWLTKRLDRGRLCPTKKVAIHNRICEGVGSPVPVKAAS